MSNFLLAALGEPRTPSAGVGAGVGVGCEGGSLTPRARIDALLSWARENSVMGWWEDMLSRGVTGPGVLAPECSEGEEAPELADRVNGYGVAEAGESPANKLRQKYPSLTLSGVHPSEVGECPSSGVLRAELNAELGGVALATKAS